MSNWLDIRLESDSEHFLDLLLYSWMEGRKYCLRRVLKYVPRSETRPVSLSFLCVCGNIYFYNTWACFTFIYVLHSSKYLSIFHPQPQSSSSASPPSSSSLSPLSSSSSSLRWHKAVSLSRWIHPQPPQSSLIRECSTDTVQPSSSLSPWICYRPVKHYIDVPFQWFKRSRKSISSQVHVGPE